MSPEFWTSWACSNNALRSQTPPPSTLLRLHVILVLHTSPYKQYFERIVRTESHPNKGPTFGDLINLGVEKLQELDTILKIILASPIAQDTYAQIIDRSPAHPVYPNEKTSSARGNVKPTNRALQEDEKIRRTFASQDFLIDMKERNLFL